MRLFLSLVVLAYCTLTWSEKLKVIEDSEMLGKTSQHFVFMDRVKQCRVQVTRNKVPNSMEQHLNANWHQGQSLGTIAFPEESVRFMCPGVRSDGKVIEQAEFQAKNVEVELVAPSAPLEVGDGSGPVPPDIDVGPDDSGEKQKFCVYKYDSEGCNLYTLQTDNTWSAHPRGCIKPDASRANQCVEYRKPDKLGNSLLHEYCIEKYDSKGCNLCRRETDSTWFCHKRGCIADTAERKAELKWLSNLCVGYARR